MQFSEQDKKELRRVAGEMGDITKKLGAFWKKYDSYSSLNMTKEFILLQERLEGLNKVFNEIPKKY